MGLGLAYVENLGSNLAVIFKGGRGDAAAGPPVQPAGPVWLDKQAPPPEASDSRMPSKLPAPVVGIPPALFRGAGGVFALGLVVDLRLPIDKLSSGPDAAALAHRPCPRCNSGMRLPLNPLNPGA